MARSIAVSTFEDAAFSYPGLERIFHERGRLAICTCLIAHPEGLSFGELQTACELTDGNLNRHLHALSGDGIVKCEKRPGGRRLLTVYRITKRGRARFLEYVDELDAVVREVHKRSHATAPGRLATT
jgi:DNA-binding transcriptional ArsR family regulator